MRALTIPMITLLALFSQLAVAGSTPPADPKAKEVECLALNIYFEARGESPAGQLAVALVSMNRVFAKGFPSTVCRVVWQPRQFSWTHDKFSDQPQDPKAWELAQRIAVFVYEKYHQLPARARSALDITEGALHYYAPEKVNPNWAKGKEITRAIGGHVFVRKPS